MIFPELMFGLVVIVLLVMALALIVNHIWVNRWCTKENARLEREYQAARALAKQNGTPPPFPPLRWEAR